MNLENAPSLLGRPLFFYSSKFSKSLIVNVNQGFRLYVAVLSYHIDSKHLLRKKKHFNSLGHMSTFNNINNNSIFTYHKQDIIYSRLCFIKLFKKFDECGFF